MIEIAGMSLIVTDRCNASCRHCGFSAGPGKKSVMPLVQAREYLQVTNSHKSALLISYTGGEPFLYYDYLKEIISSAASRGFYGEVVTNSFWADNVTKAQEILHDLRTLGVINFVTSLDDFHAEFINPEYVKTAVSIASELGYNVTVKVTGLELPGTTYTSARVKEFLAVPVKNIKIISQYPVPAGRAAEQAAAGIVGGKKFRKDVQRQKPYGRCSTVIRFPSINPDGEVYPCCGFGEKHRLLGNTNDTPLSEILINMQRNLFLNMLAYEGPVKLLDSARAYLRKTPRDDFGNICEACNYILGDADVTAAVGRVLKEIMEERTG